jgi:serine/threonine protein kinase
LSSLVSIHSLPTSTDCHQIGDSANTVVVGGCPLRCLRKLGRGSFATVWEARPLDGNHKVHSSGVVLPESGLAVKISNPINDQLLQACFLEAEILQQLATSLPQDVLAANRVPRYFSHGMGGTDIATNAVGIPQSSQFLVAMSKVEGKALDQWLYGVDENRLKTISMDDLLDRPLPGGQLATRSIGAACAASAALISQMAPVFAALSKIAYHRDVSAHNFMVRETAGKEDFSLLDFGLATQAADWPEDFRRKNICGDPRYFTPAAWMLMAFGLKGLEALPDKSIQRQYTVRIDHYSFGVLVLELLFALWCGPENEADIKGDQLLVITEAMRAWRCFWTDAMVFFQKFHCEGASSTQQALAKSSAISNFMQKQTVLCAALRVAAKKLQHSVVSSVFAIAADLIDPRGTMDWQDIPQILAETKSTSKAEVSVQPRCVVPLAPPITSRAKSLPCQLAAHQAGIPMPACRARRVKAVPHRSEQSQDGAPVGVDGTPSLATSLESAMGWVTVTLPRRVLDLAWAGADGPQRRPRRRQKAAFC